MLFLCLKHPGGIRENSLFPKDPETSKFTSKFLENSSYMQRKIHGTYLRSKSYYLYVKKY